MTTWGQADCDASGNACRARCTARRASCADLGASGLLVRDFDGASNLFDSARSPTTNGISCPIMRCSCIHHWQFTLFPPNNEICTRSIDQPE